MKRALFIGISLVVTGFFSNIAYASDFLTPSSGSDGIATGQYTNGNDELAAYNLDGTFTNGFSGTPCSFGAGVSFSCDFTTLGEGDGTYHILIWSAGGFPGSGVDYSSAVASARSDLSYTLSTGGGGASSTPTDFVLGNLAEVYTYSVFEIMRIMFWAVLLVSLIFYFLDTVFKLKI